MVCLKGKKYDVMYVAMPAHHCRAMHGLTWMVWSGVKSGDQHVCQNDDDVGMVRGMYVGLMN